MKGEVATVPGGLETSVFAEQTQRRRNSIPPVGMRVKIELICPGGEWSPKACASLWFTRSYKYLPTCPF